MECDLNGYHMKAFATLFNVGNDRTRYWFIRVSTVQFSAGGKDRISCDKDKIYSSSLFLTAIRGVGGGTVTVPRHKPGFQISHASIDRRRGEV